MLQKFTPPLLVALFAIVAFAFCGSTTANAQAVWKGREYSGRVCSNPNCGMCASIQRQIEAQRAEVIQPVQAQSSTFWKQVREPTQHSGSIDDGYELYRTETTLEPRTKQVKRCNGAQCWYETVTEMVPVTRQVPISQPVAVASKPVAQPTTKPIKPVPAVDMLANTELVPTPQAVVEAMLEELCPSNKAKLFDLGCGDGRIVITAAKQFGCTAVGIELNPKTIELARANALTEYVNPLVVLFQGDVRDYDLQPAQYVTMYLYPELMREVMPKIKSGTQIASYQHEIPGVANIKHSIDVAGQPHIFYTGIKQ